VSTAQARRCPLFALRRPARVSLVNLYPNVLVRRHSRETAIVSGYFSDFRRSRVLTGAAINVNLEL
jgi:hypothetical protein